MRTWLRSLVNAVLGKVDPGQNARWLDIATHMSMDADLCDRHESTPQGLRRGSCETVELSLSA